MQISKKEIIFFKSHGWLKVNSFLNKSELKVVKNKINNFLKKNASKYSGRDINYLDNTKNFSKINSFHRLHDLKWIKSFIKQDKIYNNTKKLLNTKKLELKASEYFAKPKRKGLPVPIHQDNYYWNVVGNKALTLWIALTESSKKNGAIFYFDKSHRSGILKHKASYAKGSSQTIKNQKSLKKFKKITPELNIGDALFHHCNIIHGSPKNKSSISRKGLTIQFKDRYSKYNKKLIRKYEKNLIKQIHNRETAST